MKISVFKRIQSAMHSLRSSTTINVIEEKIKTQLWGLNGYTPSVKFNNFGHNTLETIVISNGNHQVGVTTNPKIKEKYNSEFLPFEILDPVMKRVETFSKLPNWIWMNDNGVELFLPQVELKKEYSKRGGLLYNEKWLCTIGDELFTPKKIKLIEESAIDGYELVHNYENESAWVKSITDGIVTICYDMDNTEINSLIKNESGNLFGEQVENQILKN